MLCATSGRSTHFTASNGKATGSAFSPSRGQNARFLKDYCHVIGWISCDVRDCTTRSSSTMPAASASSSICKAASRTTSCARRSRSCQPGAPRRLRLREQHRRRRRHPVQMPHRFLQQVCDQAGIRAARARRLWRRHGVSAHRPGRRADCEGLFEQIVREEGQHVLGWRTVPTDRRHDRRRRASRTQPVMRQIFIGAGPATCDLDATTWPSSASSTSFAAGSKTPSRNPDLAQRGMFYVPSLSCKTLIYKGMLNADQLAVFFPDLQRPGHGNRPWRWSIRASAPTRFPTWARAHPYRYICHNGEINTLRGNVNWMHARESMFASRPVRRRHQEAAADHRRVAAATRPCSTTPWNCWSWPAARCRTP